MQAGDRVRTDLVDGQEQLEVAAADDRRVALEAEQGAWVRAVRAGVVTAAEIAPGEVIVQGDDGNTYFYGHLEATNVHVGQRVPAGRPVGQVGLDPGQRAVVEFGVHAGDPPHPVDPTSLLTFAPDAPAEVEPTDREAGVLVNAGTDPGFAMPPEITDSVFNQGVITGGRPAPSAAALPRTLDDAAQLLRDQGWTVEPPAAPVPPAEAAQEPSA